MVKSPTAQTGCHLLEIKFRGRRRLVNEMRKDRIICKVELVQRWHNNKEGKCRDLF